jgi:hypothetical protein
MESSIERKRLEKTPDKGERRGFVHELVSDVPWISHYVQGKDGKLTAVGAKIPWTPYKTRHGG